MRRTYAVKLALRIFASANLLIITTARAVTLPLVAKWGGKPLGWGRGSKNRLIPPQMKTAVKKYNVAPQQQESNVELDVHGTLSYRDCCNI